MSCRSLRLLLVCVLAAAAATSNAKTNEQTQTFRLLPFLNGFCPSPFASSCPWTGGDGGTATATNDCAYKFYDPLPAGSIVTQVDVRVSMFSDPWYAGKTGLVKLSESCWGCDPASVIGTFVPPTQPTGCYSGALAAFTVVTVNGTHSTDPAGLPAYNYRLNAL